MKQIIATIFLLAAAAAVTVVYFKSIHNPATPTELMRYIPADAALVAEFNNDDIFYEAYSGNPILANVAGASKTEELKALYTQVLQNAAYKDAFENERIYLSLHPSDAEQTDLLVTTAFKETFKEQDLVNAKAFSGKQLKIEGKPVYQLHINGIQRPFYLFSPQKQVLSGSFSEEVLKDAIHHDPKNADKNFATVSEQQHNNALSILYVNFAQLQPLFKQWYKAANPELFRPLRLLSAKAALSLNYKTDAFMFNGTTSIDEGKPLSYLNLFTRQKPIVNHLKDIFPAATAYSMSFAVSDSKRFTADLADWLSKSKADGNKQRLFQQIKQETGIDIQREFNTYLSKEFAAVTTRFDEKLAIIEVTNGQLLFPALMNISNMADGQIGQFKYAKLPFYLLGDAFSIFNRPYFTIINNYLILANSASELRTYTDIYNNQRFLSRTESYNDFNNLLSEQSNAAFYINFKNSRFLFRRDLKKPFYESFNDDHSGLKNFYAASFQLIAADRDFYTNFSMQLAAKDTVNTHK
ncbi:hypothetical protein MUY27_04355 [Mucilaginibacter sp. RS28]|uniref:DUF3352 domain-containing protein n=1 Tax=Mucilaginibacter straminoryzae TaxID=2932774 RepID=A0A9X1X0T3_9SPHI|nr:hypothetical protein [Mucilaginibacter straminoryzae]MCJ8208928.1 hypothetical protein [Mucilaginibacter straminoryzae]